MLLAENTRKVKQIAHELGFDECGIAHAAQLEGDALRLETWLAAKYHAGMQWMENHFEKRVDPTKLVEGAKSVIVVLQNYFPNHYPFENSKYKISRYALGVDYHKVMKVKLNKMLTRINNEVKPTQGRCFVDSAPVMERAWAREAGLGWIGKNSLLINKNKGSYFFIGVLVVNTEFEYDAPVTNHCGNCNICMQACPTQAIVSSAVVDSNRCLSFQTIENKGNIPEHIAASMNGRIFGCDICQEVCPWNKAPLAHQEPMFDASPLIQSLTDAKIANISETEFETVFERTAVKRAKYSGFIRNVKAASQ